MFGSQKCYVFEEYTSAYMATNFIPLHDYLRGFSNGVLRYIRELIDYDESTNKGNENT